MVIKKQAKVTLKVELTQEEYDLFLAIAQTDKKAKGDPVLLAQLLIRAKNEKFQSIEIEPEFEKTVLMQLASFCNRCVETQTVGAKIAVNTIATYGKVNSGKVSKYLISKGWLDKLHDSDLLRDTIEETVSKFHSTDENFPKLLQFQD
ncbi:MAG: hypothetical protein KME10_27965 [Plectolyngbya sp. WJT66-NPBG17]|jgi:hypothetical protein|nr:hypothetical protein [Plectolyngbya sp. WJT66-NPBG17]